MKNTFHFSRTARMRCLTAGVALLLALTIGCGSDPIPTPQQLPAGQQLPDVSINNVRDNMVVAGSDTLTISSSLGGYETVAAAAAARGPNEPPVPTVTNVWDLLWQNLSHAIQFTDLRPYKLTFSVTAGSSPETGLVIVPYTLTNYKFPIISLQHPTQVERYYSPSNGHYLDNQLTVPFGYLLASMGYIVLIPDYRGMGDNYDVHPYCMNSLGQSVSAMITSALAFKPSGAWGRKYSMPWDGRTFLMGFSEGGYATMVAAADIQANHPSFNLLAVAPLDGPYSVSVTMRSVMLTANNDFPAPYFLPFTIAGYGAYNPGIPAIQWGAAIVSYPQGFMPKLYTLLDGSHTAGEISNWMRTVPGYKGPITVTSETFQAALNDTGSTVNQALQVNDGFAGWKPATMQIHMFHNKIDDLVPKENTDNAVAAWAGLANVTATYYPEWLTPMGTVHAGSLPFAYIYGTNWLNSIAMPGSAAQGAPPSQ